MRIDLHNHTHLCNHAEGEPFEYIEEAIKQKIDFYGFSDHNPMNFDPKHRMRFYQLSLYFQMIDEVQEKYKDSITILKGLPLHTLQYSEFYQ